MNTRLELRCSHWWPLDAIMHSLCFFWQPEKTAATQVWWISLHLLHHTEHCHVARLDGTKPTADHQSSYIVTHCMCFSDRNEPVEQLIVLDSLCLLLLPRLLSFMLFRYPPMILVEAICCYGPIFKVIPFETLQTFPHDFLHVFATWPLGFVWVCFVFFLSVWFCSAAGCLLFSWELCYWSRPVLIVLSHQKLYLLAFKFNHHSCSAGDFGWCLQWLHQTCQELLDRRLSSQESLLPKCSCF